MTGFSRGLSGAVFAGTALCAVLAAAQPYPTRPVRMVMPYPAGGPTDLIGRVVAQGLSAALGQPVIVENRPGASALVGTEAAARAPADGYTLLMATSTNAINAAGHPRLPYDLVKDFEPVIYIASACQVLVVHPSLPSRTTQQLVSLARAKPGQLNFASSGTGTSGHLAMELLKTMTKVDIVHIPYKGSAPAMNDLLGGQVAIAFVNIIAGLPPARLGKLRALAVSCIKRSALAPDLPTVAESGLPGFDIVAWFGVMVPARTPKEVVARLNSEIARVIQMSETFDRLVSQGAEPVAANTPEQFRAFVASDIAKWRKLMDDAGIRLD